MRLLLDTNILIPLVDGAARSLPREVLALLRSDDVEMWASVASTWEVAIKHRLGKLPLPCPPEEWPILLTNLNVAIMPVRTAHVIAAPVLPLSTKDPFDRLFIAICGVERMQLVTTDAELSSHPLAWRPSPA
ncbi:MAG TPA: type II toxin-antitoxin system VapC family toxin [Allosphingosinicella sp.]